MKARSHAGLSVVSFLGEFRIQDQSGAIVGSGADNGAHFRAAERFLLNNPYQSHKDSIGYVWLSRKAAESALSAIAKNNLK